MQNSRYHLDGLTRPELDPSAWTGTAPATGAVVRVCLVSRELGEATQRRVGTAIPRVVQVLEVLPVGGEGVTGLAHRDPRGELLVVLEGATSVTLAERVQSAGPFDPETAVRLMLAVADALKAIHAAGAFHGGLTPLAIDVADDGAVRLGLAGIQDAGIAYQSPSRLSSEGLSALDDAWGLLACLYYAVTGAAPFNAANAAALARRVLGARPLPIRMTTPAERDLQTLFTRGFTREPSRRYPDVEVLREDLLAWLAAHGEVPETAGPPRAAFSLTEPARPSVRAPISDPRAEPGPPPAAPAEPADVRAVESAPPVEANLTEGRDEVSEKPPAELTPPATPPPVVRPKKARALLMAGLGAASVAVLAMAWLTLRAGPTASSSTPVVASAASASARPDPGAVREDRARVAEAPPASTSDPAPAASAVGENGARPPDLDACVAAWFPASSFDPDTDISFVCSQRDGRGASSKLRRALLAGGKNKKITAALREWQRFGWFEAPVVATLRAQCCPGAPALELPHVTGSSCVPPTEAAQALGAATARGSGIDTAIRAYRKVVACLVDSGDSPAYGQPGAVGVGEEPAFRDFAARGPRR